eukprot:TRINITY_DN440_c0_g1_i6.p1 TRINITY_DN440_c0_g1~~TRINITY_DN440_c0_g1_i6.p1  ORF type:complete len:535 (+),score=140.25 TRINITY_DN440_c0_g1_i6:166-1770(+)
MHVSSAVLVLLSLTGCYFCVVESDNSVRSRKDNADAGIFRGYPTFTGFTNTDVVSNGNKAISNTGVANSGSRLFTSRTGDVAYTSSELSSKIYDNTARSRTNTAVAGEQNVFSDFQAADISFTSDVYDNKASVTSRKNITTNIAAISGLQLQAGSVSQGSNMSVTGNVFDNVAVSRNNAQAISGVDFAVGSLSNSDIYTSFDAADNLASTQDGRSTAGVKQSFAYVSDSNIYSNSVTSDNEASAEGYSNNAVAGAQNNFGTINQSSFGDNVIVLNDIASGNSAVAYNGGDAVSGVQTTGASIFNSLMSITSEANNNRAGLYGSDPAAAKDAIAGASINFGYVNGSAVVAQLTTSENYAYNQHKADPSFLYNDAIAGTQVNIDVVNNTLLGVTANSSLNYAEAIYGDAIAGNQVNIGTAENVFGGISLDASNNTAFSGNGDAVAGNQFNVNETTTFITNLNMYAVNNTAVAAASGDAVAGNQVNVGYEYGAGFVANATLVGLNNTAVSVNGASVITTELNIGVSPSPAPAPTTTP